MPIFNRPRPPEPGAPPPARRADPLEAALRAAEVLSGGISTADAVAEIRRAALGLVGASHVSLLLLRPDGRTLELVAAGGLAIPAPEGSSLPAAEGVAGHVVSTARPVRLDAADTPRLGDLAPVEGDGESVLVPLRAAGDPIGVLHLALPAAMRVTDDDVRLMQLFADQAAGAIHRARLQERAERRSGDLMALVEASRGLVGALDTDALLHAVLEGGLRLAGSDRGFTSLFQGSPPKIVRGAFRGFDKATIARLAAVEEVGRAAGSGEVVALAWEDSSLIVVGLGSTRATSGVLVAEAGGADVADRIDLLRAFGGQCASALSAADLHTQVLRKESEMNSIIHGVPYPIVLTDADLRVVTINWAAEQLFGTSSAWVAGASAADALPNPALVDLLSAPGDVQGEIVAGSPGRTYKVRAADVRVPGAPRGRVAIMDDVTSEREMVQMQRDFVAMIGHELRTPLTIVKGFARTALRRPEDLSETARDAFQTIDARAGQ
ncbi:MAG TPA: GAF domain-containing protein, partial [Actinomycetota bacterium]|nr:GAF domain-containing protein [Actinomycetota bacterium]